MSIILNLNFETILLLLAILASNGFIYSLTIFTLNKSNSSENISVITNNSEKDVLGLTLLISSNPLRITSSESSSSNPLSVTSSESSSSQTLSVTSSDTLVSEDIFDSENFIDEEFMNEAPNTILIDTHEGLICDNSDIFDHTTSLDSITILNSQSLQEWREIVHDLHDLPFNTPIGILQQIKFEELNILYSQDIIEFAITQTELRLIIELIPALSLFRPDINHFILTIMSYYHL
jgi:hypothetical protein